MTLLGVVALPFLAALLLLAVDNRARNLAATVAGGAALAGAALLAFAGPEVFAGGAVAISWPWLPLPGANFGFRADGLGWMFAALVLGIGALVILYARYYLSDEDPIARFYALFMFFMGAMLGLVLADNLLLLVVFWELTSIASFLLIGFWRHRSDARQGARMALAVTGFGGLALLGGVLLLGEMAGSYSLEIVLGAGDRIRAHELYLPMLLLVLLGAFTKSAQVPFHFWLPHAMAAPTPVSAYLHSATMVKAGVFLLARLQPAIGGSEAWFFIVSAVGLATLVVSAYIAIFQHDLKGLLAYSTISHLGLIVLLFGLGGPLATVAAVFHILNHATFKASLFMAAGIIDHETGTRDMRRLAGLWSYMPLTAVLAILAAAAMAGVPLFNGFLSKEMFFAETLYVDVYAVPRIVVPLITTIAAAFAVAYSTRFIHDVFFNGEPVGLPRSPHEPPAWMLAPVGVLAALCLLVGILPAYTVGPLLALGAQAALQGPLPEYSLKIWHGFNVALAMSAVALAGGAALYFSLQRVFRLHDRVHMERGGKEIYDAALAALTAAARRAFAQIDAGGLRRYARWLVLATLVAWGVPLLVRGIGAGERPLAPVDLVTAIVWSIGIAGILVVLALHRRRLATLVALGVIGLVVSLSFAALSAPDLALTQLLVEVVSIVLLLLALHYLPQESPREPNRGRVAFDTAIAAAAGLAIAALAFAVLTRGFDPISPWLLENAVPGAAGSNAVNVILVDFRGFDTLGEIVVLGVAALAVFGLLLRVSPAERSFVGSVPPDLRRSTILELVGRVLLPLAVLVSAFMFLRGHNLPGGGFIAGLIFAVALLVPYMGSGAAWVEERIRVDYQRVLGAGLLIAAATGLGSFFFGHPFLTSTYLAPVAPLVGKIPIASAMFFDLGVYVVVAAATMLALSSLGKLSIAPPPSAAERPDRMEVR
jgi:multicomponent K+:H+ antiporter subunit A